MELSTSTIFLGIINVLLLLAMVVGVVALIVYLMRRNSGERKCSACGKKAPADARVCPYCGESLM